MRVLVAHYRNLPRSSDPFPPSPHEVVVNDFFSSLSSQGERASLLVAPDRFCWPGSLVASQTTRAGVCNSIVKRSRKCHRG